MPAGKTFAMHFDYMIHDSRVIRLSVSNLYKEFKNNKGTSLQVPLLNLPSDRWVFVVINALSLFKEHNIFDKNSPAKFYMRSFQMHANVWVKGVYTSDIQYHAMNLPKDM